MPDLLIELFSEEIPARMQKRASDDLKRLMTSALVEAGLSYASAGAFATPRRLSLSVEGLLSESPASEQERKGPRSDAPEKAIEGFLRSTGLTRDQLQERETPKGNVLFATIKTPARPAQEIVAECLAQTVQNFPWPKSMRWGAGSLRWVRPLHSIIAILYDEEGVTQVPLELEGVHVGAQTQGHRFMAPAFFQVSSFDDYSAKLKAAKVMLDPAERADSIWNDATNLAFAQGYEVIEDPALLSEVAGLVEWPVPLLGKIDPEFLDLPPEVLQTSMREHQKFFSLRNPKTNQIEAFITVANRETADAGATILAGNRKVLSARLADAKFFWENDLRIAKTALHEWTAALENVTFHRKLGSQSQRIARIRALTAPIAAAVGANAAAASEAAQYAKADLSSQMVYEFPELQGLMGRYYLQAAGHSAEIATAAETHYAPLGPSDEVPSEPISMTVALSDKLDLLAGFWAIDEKPTGSKDPFALRRAGLGVLRILLEHQIRMPLRPVLRDAIAAHIGGDTRDESEQMPDVDKQLHDLTEELLSFLHERLKVFMRDRGISHDVVDACLAMPANDDIAVLMARADALYAVMQSEDGLNLLQAFRRADKIVQQAEEADGVEYSFGADVKFAEDDAEKALFAALDSADPKILSAIAQEDFTGAMTGLAALREPVDNFFEAVQINSDNQTLRRNRLNLLTRIRELCLRVADLRRLNL